MKAFISALVVSAVLALGASFILQSQQKSSTTAFTTDSVRVGETSTNLIGTN